MENSAIEELIRYLQNKSYPPNFQKNEKRRLREKSESFQCLEGSLYHKGHGGKSQRVVTKDEVPALLSQMHASVVGGCHFGQNATQSKIADRFWWPTMTEDIRVVFQLSYVNET